MKRYVCWVALAVMGVVQAAPTLGEGFREPPHGNRPQVWWWFDATAPEAAITRDLEALARVGAGGFHIYGGSATNSNWLHRTKWALHEANRLGLDGIVCIGSAGCGHPQTEARHAQKDLVFTRAEAAVAAGAGVRVKLPKKGVKETPRNKDGTPRHYWDIAVLAVPKPAGKDDFVPVADVRDVSRFFNSRTEELVWPDAPAGTWTFLRAGYVPKVFGWMGCYIDHMSRAAFDAHWARVMTPLLAVLAPDERAALKGVMCDSWEAGTVSWTDSFADEFKTRRGYDLTCWLPAKAGVRLDHAGRLARFLRDFDETISELIAENHYAYQKEVANRHGLASIAEAAGPHQGQGDVWRMQGRCDVAMGEFWMPSAHRPADEQRFMVRDAANAAHVYGMGEVLAESFTTINTWWTEYPATLKPCADRAFCDGLTRVCYHGMKLSPSLTDRPGVVRNVGTHYNPQVTWFEQSRAFNDYLSRCSWMLSQGRFVADALLYAGDSIGLFAGMKSPSDGLGVGYDYDFCPTELLLRARVENGEIVLPSGMRYKALVLSDRSPKTRLNLNPGRHDIKVFPPCRHAIGEAAMLRMKELVEAGATLIGERPSGPVSMLSSSERYHAAADVLWGPRGSAQQASRTVGLGRVLRARSTFRAILPPDFVAEWGQTPRNEEGQTLSQRGQSPKIDWIHRKNGDFDIYFVSNQGDSPVAFTGCFRVGARSAELWNPVTATMRTVPAETGTAPMPMGTDPVRMGTDPVKSSRIRIELPSFGSLFVVFGRSQRGLSPEKRDLSPAMESAERGQSPIKGTWSVQFDPAWGGPTEPQMLTKLIDWTAFEDPGIRYYSGTAVYRTRFDVTQGVLTEGRTVHSPNVTIDLGELKNVAEVVLNGKNLGIVWTSPYEVSVGNALRAKGNELEVRVTNLWPNRLIYDAGLPLERRLTRTNFNTFTPTNAPLSSGLLGPVRLRWAFSRQSL